MEDERRQEEELRRQLEMERRQMEEERRRIQEKKEAEERRLEAVKEAIAGAQQNAMAERMAKRKAVIQMQQEPIEQVMVIHHPATSTSVSPAPNIPIPSPSTFINPPPPSANMNRNVVDAQVQTDQFLVLKVPCHCDNDKPSSHLPRSRGGQTAVNHHRSDGGEDDRSATRLSMVGLKSQSTSNSTTPVVRPLWGAHKSTAKYQVSSRTARCFHFARLTNQHVQKLISVPRGTEPDGEGSAFLAAPPRETSTPAEAFIGKTASRILAVERKQRRVRPLLRFPSAAL